MARSNSALKIKKSRQQTIRESFRKRKLSALFGAAMALPGLGLTSSAVAQTVAEAPEMKISYSEYRERQAGGDDRMRVHTPIAWVRTPIGEKSELEGSFSLDTMGGASSYYLGSLTGASGYGVTDYRKTVDAKLTHIFDGYSVGVGGNYSDENDYTSKGIAVDSKIWTPDKNTTLAYGISSHWDEIGLHTDKSFSKARKTQNYFVGVTQVLDADSIIESNLSYTAADGYQEDPYKPLDNRPGNRGQWAWLTRYNVYFEDLGGALHSDYRYYQDTFGISSNMVEFQWFQPVGSSWIIRPNLRYYTQSRAEFFTGAFPPDPDTFYSGDQRMGDFGSITTGIKFVKDLGDGLSADLNFQFVQQRPSLKLGSSIVSGLEPFYEYFVMVGLAKKF